VLLPRMIPEKRALEMMLTGRPLSAGEAERFGLVNRVIPLERFEREVERFENHVLASSPAVLSLARRAARMGSRSAFEAALREAERLYLEELMRLPDAVEGLNAFLEKRAPAWKD
jgi:crotonobetainyl-CoA hydratase